MTSIKKAFGSALANFLSHTLNRSNKRLIFLATLAAFLKNDTDPDAQVLKKLNELFSLGKDPKTLRFPMMIHPRIWNAFNISDLQDRGINYTSIHQLERQEMSMKQTRILANHLIRYAPKWLKYDSSTKMRDDIYKLLDNAKQLQSASKLVVPVQGQ